MTRRVHVAGAAALCVAALGLSGCFATGGGQLVGLGGAGGKINTGFQLRCSDLATGSRVTGQFQYHDRGAHVAFHVSIDRPLSEITGDNSLSCAQYAALGQFAGGQAFQAIGTYRPQPKNAGPGGDATVTVVSRDIAGTYCPPGVDLVVVQVGGGMYGGYAQSACLDKGNITMSAE